MPSAAKIASNKAIASTLNKGTTSTASKSSGGGESSTPTAAPVVTPAKDMNQARIDALGEKGDATPTFATQAETDQYNKTMALMKSTNGQGNPISTTTLTNGNVIDNVIPENNSKLDTLGVKGAVTNPDGSQSNADGSIISDGETKGYTYQGADGNIYDSKTGKIVEGSVDVGAIENKADQNTNDLLESMKAMTDANTAAQIENIKASFAVRKQQQADSNTRNESSVMNALLMGGVTGQGSSSQYAPVSSTGIVSAQETYGIQQIANLDAEENNLIAQAKQAQEEGNYRLMEKQLDLVEAKRKEKTAMAIKINDSIIATNKAQQEKNYQSGLENEIANLFTEGKTSTPEILKTLTAKGYSVTSKEINDVLSNMANNAGVDVSKMSADTQEFYALKNSGGLPASILTKTSTGDQLLEWLKLKKKAESTPTSLSTNPDGTIPSDAIDENSGSILMQTGLSIPAFAYLTQGPTALTRMTPAERVQYMNEAADWANKKNVDISTFKSSYEAYNTALQSNIKRVNQVKVAEGELQGTLDNLTSAGDDASFKNMRVANIAKLWAGQEFNDPNVSKYAFHLNQLRSEMALYNSAAAGKPSTDDSDYKEAERIIKEGFAAGSIKGFQKALKASVSKMDVILSQNVDRTNKQVWDLFGVGNNFKNKTIAPASYDDLKNTGFSGTGGYDFNIWNQ